MEGVEELVVKSMVDAMLSVMLCVAKMDLNFVTRHDGKKTNGWKHFRIMINKRSLVLSSRISTNLTATVKSLIAY